MEKNFFFLNNLLLLVVAVKRIDFNMPTEDRNCREEKSEIQKRNLAQNIVFISFKFILIFASEFYSVFQTFVMTHDARRRRTRTLKQLCRVDAPTAEMK